MIKNYLIKIFDREGKTKKEFVIEESTPKKALKRLMRVKFYTENQTLIGNIVSMTEEKQWFFRMTIKAFYERGTEITISKLDYKYHDYTEDEVYAGLETIGDISTYRKGKIKPFPTDIGTKKTTDWSNLKFKKSFKNTILKFLEDGFPDVFYFIITTGIDLNYFSFSSTVDVSSISETSRNLLSKGKRVNLILYNSNFIVNRKPLTLSNQNPKELAKSFPSSVKIIRITRKDFEEVILS